VLDGTAKAIVVVSKAVSHMTVHETQRQRRRGYIPWRLRRPHERPYVGPLPQGIKKILLEGGGSTSRRMFNEGLVDEVYLTIAPVLIGQGVDLFHGELDRNIELGLEGILQYGDHVILHYTVKHGE